MVPLDVAGTWTRMLSGSAGACAAAGAPGPATRLRGRPLDPSSGPWLGIFDFQTLRRSEREVGERWLWKKAEPLLLVRHLLLAQPIGEDVFVELTPQALLAMPEGWRAGTRPILPPVPAGRSRAGRGGGQLS